MPEYDNTNTGTLFNAGGGLSGKLDLGGNEYYFYAVKTERPGQKPDDPCHRIFAIKNGTWEIIGGSLKRNDQAGNDKRPTVKGTIHDETGQVWFLSGWPKQGKSGMFLSIKAELPKDEAPKAEETPAEDFNCPF